MTRSQSILEEIEEPCQAGCHPDFPSISAQNFADPPPIRGTDIQKSRTAERHRAKLLNSAIKLPAYGFAAIIFFLTLSPHHPIGLLRFEMRVIHLDNTFGSAFVGMTIAATLHGVSCVQAWYYFTHQSDRWPIKSLVAAVMFFDTVHQALITHTVYSYTVTNWGNTDILPLLVWSLLVEVLFNGLTALLVQSFLTMRVWRLSNQNMLLTGLTALLVIAEFTCVIAFTGLSIRMETFGQLAKLESLSITVNALAAAGDVLIAATLCTILHRSRTGFHRSDTMINKLILFSVNTGFLTSLCAVGSLISIVVAGHTFLYIAFFFCIGRLYTNSLLATLNARKMIRGSADAVHSTSDKFSFSLRDLPKNGTITSSHNKRPANISIKIDTTKEFAMDRDSEKETVTMDAKEAGIICTATHMMIMHPPQS